MESGDYDSTSSRSRRGFVNMDLAASNIGIPWSKCMLFLSRRLTSSRRALPRGKPELRGHQMPVSHDHLDTSAAHKDLSQDIRVSGCQHQGKRGSVRKVSVQQARKPIHQKHYSILQTCSLANLHWLRV